MTEESVHGLDAAIRELDARTTLLWIIALAFFGVGDLATTYIGLSSGHLVESGPLASVVVDRFEASVLVLLKLAAVGVCLLLWRLTPRPSAVSVPFALTVFGILVTGWNMALLLTGL